jgi:diguanylate cyclase (GGDEF)-like protein
VWKILVVDDDQDVHLATTLALAGVEMLGRVPQFLHATSAAEAEQLLIQEPDIAVILLDVVMETQDAGLQLVDKIRHGLGLEMPRIILRTGQPGYAPELNAIRDYDINDYKTKSELTRTKLFTAVLAALRSYDQLRRMAASQQGLEQVAIASGELLGETSLPHFAASIVEQLITLVGANADGLFCMPSSLVQPNQDVASSEETYVVLAATGQYESLLNRPLNGIGSPHIVAEISRCLAHRQQLFAQDHLCLFVPMRGDTGFAVYIDAPVLEAEKVRILEVFCANIAICADNIHLINSLKDFAYFDRMVGLPNRTAFVKAVDQVYAEGKAEQYVATLLDIDQFAEINNAFGHEYGDQLLQHVAQRLTSNFAPDCFIARLSGDAFAMLGSAECLQSKRLRKVLEQTFNINGVAHMVAISTGAVHLRDSGPSGYTVLKDASIARKLAHEKGVNSDACYSPHIGALAKARTHLLQQLQSAFQGDQLYPVFQPQINLVDGRVLGFEALMRWRNGAGEAISPELFIHVAEQSGLIIEMGIWILRESLFALRELQAEGWDKLRMSVNVSAVQFRTPGFLAAVRQALDDSGIDPSSLELEITESVAMTERDAVEHTLRQIREMGVEIAIDDFGTGFSSLSYLDKLPLDRIKIDRAFIHTMQAGGEGQRLAELVIQMGHSLNLRVIAEGVENEMQANRLLELGCREAQGFLYGHPMKIADLREWLNSNKSQH